jgi:hypothetical protein
LPLKIEIHRIGIGRLLGAPRLCGDELGVKLVGEPRHDLVLRVEEIAQRLVRTLGPQAPAGLRFDQLHVVGRQALGNSVDEIVLLGIAADVGEGQHDERKTRRLAARGARAWALSQRERRRRIPT